MIVFNMLDRFNGCARGRVPRALKKMAIPNFSGCRTESPCGQLSRPKLHTCLDKSITSREFK